MSNTNKVVLVLVIIFVICVLFGYARSRVSLINGKYVNRKFGFEITPPPSWKIKQIDNNRIMFYGSRERNLYTALSISITDEATEDLESYVNFKKSRLTAPEYKFHSSSQTKIGDVEAYELVYTLMAKIESASKTSYEPFRKFKTLFLLNIKLISQ